MLWIQIKLRYDPDVAGGDIHEYAGEEDPHLHVFITHGLHGSRSGVDVVPPTLVKAQAGSQGHLILDLPFVPGHGMNIPASASVGFAAYAETATQSGGTCRSRVGTSHVLVSELLHGEPGSRIIHRPMIQNTGSTPLVKGFLQVSGGRILQGKDRRPYLGPALVWDPIGTQDVFHVTDGSEELRALAGDQVDRMRALVESSLAIFFAPEGSSEAPALGTSDPAYLSRMHCPYYQTPLALIGGSDYASRFPLETPPPEFWTRTLGVTLARLDARAEDLLELIQAQADNPSHLVPGMRYVVMVYLSMVSVYANSFDYLDDFTNSGGDTLVQGSAGSKAMVSAAAGARGGGTNVEISEDYKTARLGEADDCEGLGDEIFMEIEQFRRTDLSRLGPGPIPDLAKALQRDLAWSRALVPMLELAGVSNKKLVAGTRFVKPDDALAHTYTVIIPTAKLLGHLEGAGVGSAAVDAIRNSAWVREYVEKPWHGQLEVMVGEGTAKSSPWVLPIGTYYEDPRDRSLAVTLAKARASAQSALSRDLPSDIVSLEVMQLEFEDPGGEILNDLRNASPFYNAQSALYVSAFSDTGILDLAWASKRPDGTLTHGASFNRMIRPVWDSDLALVPYNHLSREYRDLSRGVLSQLEPIPVIRRDPAVAGDIEQRGAPGALARIPDLFDGPVPPRGLATAGVSTDPGSRMPLPPTTITVTVRDKDLGNNGAEAISWAIDKHHALFSGARVHTYYLSAPPVAGDQSILPSVIIHDIELALAGFGDPSGGIR